MALDPTQIDQRPSPWKAHAWVLGGLAVAYGVFAILAWPGSGDSLKAGLVRLVVILYGVALVLFAGVTTALVAAFRPRRAQLIRAYAVSIGIVALVIGASLLR